MAERRRKKHRLHDPQGYLDHVARWMLIIAGMICVGLGALGILLPGLPTTPFLLVAAYCFARSSEHFHSWLIHHRWFGSYVRNFEEGRGMTRRAKAGTLLTMWVTIGITIVFLVPVRWGQVGMFLMALAVSTYLLRLPTPEAETVASVSGGPGDGERSAQLPD